MLSCRIPAQESALGAPCCRLSLAHQAGRPRARRYPSDTTDAQWALIDPLLPDPAWLAGKGGRPETHCRRQIVDAIFYVVDNGIKWRALPADFPPWSTVYNFFAGWEADGITQLLLDMLRERVRLAEGRTATPTAAIIDSQSVKAAENVWRSSRGYDAGKKINGRKRHIAVDTLGLLICVLVTAASVQDRDGARPLLQRLAESLPPHPTRVGRRRIRRQTSGLGPRHAAHHHADRQTQGRHDRIRCPTKTVGRRTQPGLDHQTPPLRPRLRSPPYPPRIHGPLGHDPHHQPPPHSTMRVQEQALEIRHQNDVGKSTLIVPPPYIASRSTLARRGRSDGSSMEVRSPTRTAYVL